MSKALETWSVPLALSDVPETGRRIDLVAEPPIRAAVAKLAGVRDIPRLLAGFDVTPRGDGLRVTGHVRATVGQDCVVTLEPVENEIDEPVDLVFVPTEAALPAGARLEGAEHADNDDAPEPLVGGAIDLGAIATEFLLLAIDPYPRKPGAVFQAPPAGADTAHPFAALSVLKKGQDDSKNE